MYDFYKIGQEHEDFAKNLFTVENIGNIENVLQSYAEIQYPSYNPPKQKAGEDYLEYHTRLEQYGKEHDELLKNYYQAKEYRKIAQNIKDARRYGNYTQTEQNIRQQLVDNSFIELENAVYSDDKFNQLFENIRKNELVADSRPINEDVTIGFKANAKEFNKQVFESQGAGIYLMQNGNALIIEMHGSDPEHVSDTFKETANNSKVAYKHSQFDPSQIAQRLEDTGLIPDDVTKIFFDSCYGGLQKPGSTNKGIPFSSIHTSQKPVYSITNTELSFYLPNDVVVQGIYKGDGDFSPEFKKHVVQEYLKKGKDFNVTKQVANQSQIEKALFGFEAISIEKDITHYTKLRDGYANLIKDYKEMAEKYNQSYDEEITDIQTELDKHQAKLNTLNERLDEHPVNITENQRTGQYFFNETGAASPKLEPNKILEPIKESSQPIEGQMSLFDKEIQEFFELKENKPKYTAKHGPKLKEKPKQPKTSVPSPEPIKSKASTSTPKPKPKPKPIKPASKMKTKSIGGMGKAAIAVGAGFVIGGIIASSQKKEQSKKEQQVANNTANYSNSNQMYYDASYSQQIAKDISTYRYGKRMTGFV